MDGLRVAIGYSYVDYFTIETEWDDWFTDYGNTGPPYIYTISTPHSNSKIGWEVNELRVFNLNGVGVTYTIVDGSGHHGTNDRDKINDNDISTYWEAGWNPNVGQHYVRLAQANILSRLQLYQSNQLQQTVIVEIAGKMMHKTHTQKKKIFFCLVFWVFLSKVVHFGEG